MIYAMSMAGTGGIKENSTAGAGNSKPVRMGMHFDMDSGEVVFFNQEVG